MKVSCTRCGQRLQVPAAPAPPAVVQNRTVLGEPLPALAPAPPAPAPGARPPDATPLPRQVRANCPGCGREIPLAAGELGALIECARCGTRFVPAGPAAPAPGRPPSDPSGPEDAEDLGALLGLVPDAHLEGGGPEQPEPRRGRSAAPAPGGHSAKRQGFPPWLHAVIVAAGVLLLLLGGAGLSFFEGRISGIIAELSPHPPLPAMDLAAYKAQRPPGGARVTATCHIQQNSSGVYGVWLSANGRFETAYVSQSAPEARDVFQALKDGQEHWLTLEIRPLTERDGITVTGLLPGVRPEASLILQVIKDLEAPDRRP
jgi:hypothetical protein